MRVQVVFTLLATSAWSVAAVPTTGSAKPDHGLRLIMTSPGDPGRWVTEEQKIRDYKAKGIGFVDITDITDAQVLAALSTPDAEGGQTFSVQAVSYPTTVTHQTEVNSLLTKVSTTNPQSWLKTLTEYVARLKPPRQHDQDGTKTLASPD
jgi:bacterial leucyl aminopeptidase